jgi:photosystem II stability/assembly factor-like uncharacterized protein
MPVISPNQWRLVLMAVACGWLLPGSFRAAFAESAPLVLKAGVAEPTPEQDDATIFSVATVGTSTVWGVGDRGVVWRSDDGGTTWTFLQLPPALSRYAFHDICFLTDRVGWIAGGTVLDVGGVPRGVVLATTDGGETWSARTEIRFPYLRHIQFFDLEHGLAAGDRSTQFPTGVLQTEDGGQTWHSLPAPQSGKWNAAAFLDLKSGVVAGDHGRHAVITNGSILKNGTGAHQLNALHSLSLDAGGRAWIAGDGAALLRSDNHGVSWTPMQSRLPRLLEDVADFHAVAHLRNHVWVAGHPGSVIWHSEDGGESWVPQPTGDGIPFTALHFMDAQRGFAVGHLGRISMTSNGGASWKTVHGGGRHLACLAIPTHVEHVPISFVARSALEDGYRVAVMVATRRDIGQDAHRAEQLELNVPHAIQTAGGNAAWIDWRLPLMLPGLEQDREKLIEEWALLTDRRLEDVLLSGLVSKIRAWRPSALLIEEADSGEFAADLMQRAVARAMELARDPNYAAEQMQVAQLAPWTVRKLILQRLPGQQGSISQDPFEVLPRRGTTLDLACRESFGQLDLPRVAMTRRMDYLVLQTAGTPPVSDRLLLSDLALAPGSGARRMLPEMTEADHDRLLAETTHRRQLAAVTERLATSPQGAGLLLGQLNEIVEPLSSAQAAEQLANLGQTYHQRGEWGLAESVYAELITRYPEQPRAAEAMLWLMTFWSSTEMNWQRLKAVQASRTRFQVEPPGPAVSQAKLEEAVSILMKQKSRTAAALNTPSIGLPVTVSETPLIPSTGTLQSVITADGNRGNQYQGLLSRWQMSAVAVSSGLRQAYPQLFETPSIQFVSAALARRRGDPKQADEIYGEFMKTLSDDPWSIAARGEAYLLRPGPQSPKPMIVCKQTNTPPVLDGMLSDACWQQAPEVRLSETADGNIFVGTKTLANAEASAVAQPVIFFAHDDRYLYLAASVPVDPRLPADGPQLAGRVHDADLDRFDRLSLQFDIDRDYATYYRFDIDQRGWTRESCWDNWSYDPQWYCAAVRSADVWRVECAIPLDELLPPERLAGTTWTVGLTRILPGIGSQSWTASGAEYPQPPLFGMMRFE